MSKYRVQQPHSLWHQESRRYDFDCAGTSQRKFKLLSDTWSSTPSDNRNRADSQYQTVPNSFNFAISQRRWSIIYFSAKWFSAEARIAITPVCYGDPCRRLQKKLDLHGWVVVAVNKWQVQCRASAEKLGWSIVVQIFGFRVIRPARSRAQSKEGWKLRGRRRDGQRRWRSVRFTRRDGVRLWSVCSFNLEWKWRWTVSGSWVVISFGRNWLTRGVESRREWVQKGCKRAKKVTSSTLQRKGIRGQFGINTLINCYNVNFFPSSYSFPLALPLPSTVCRINLSWRTRLERQETKDGKNLWNQSLPTQSIYLKSSPAALAKSTADIQSMVGLDENLLPPQSISPWERKSVSIEFLPSTCVSMSAWHRHPSLSLLEYQSECFDHSTIRRSAKSPRNKTGNKHERFQCGLQTPITKKPQYQYPKQLCWLASGSILPAKGRATLHRRYSLFGHSRDVISTGRIERLIVVERVVRDGMKMLELRPWHIVVTFGLFRFVRASLWK